MAAYRAAHWDGKIETGQAVSSGTYFYQLKAGDHTETRINGDTEVKVLIN